MLFLEILILEFLAPDRLAASTLLRGQIYIVQTDAAANTYVAASEITPLEHELGDHTMEFRALVSIPLFTRT